MARQFGLGQTYDLKLPLESRGLVPDQNWKRGQFGTEWHLGETINATIGQGYILTTPMQLAVMTSRLCNGGYAVVDALCRFHLVDLSIQIRYQCCHVVSSSL